ncbi:hypothetical protein [Mycobacterium sp. DL]|uniref:hypothetical protein n=1 Tax=Mycobacterium sp. DL TaxID=3145017 RepID=UPI0032192C32
MKAQRREKVLSVVNRLVRMIFHVADHDDGDKVFTVSEDVGGSRSGLGSRRSPVPEALSARNGRS